MCLITNSDHSINRVSRFEMKNNLSIINTTEHSIATNLTQSNPLLWLIESRLNPITKFDLPKQVIYNDACLCNRAGRWCTQSLWMCHINGWKLYQRGCWGYANFELTIAVADSTFLNRIEPAVRCFLSEGSTFALRPVSFATWFSNSWIMDCNIGTSK